MPTPSDDTIDSREIIEEINDLEAEIESLRNDIVDLEEQREELQAEMYDLETGDPNENDARMTEIDQEIESIEIDMSEKTSDIEATNSELKPLTDLRDEVEPYCPDWPHGVTLVADDYFEDYAYEMARDIGAIPDDMSWPANCIDWTKAANALQMDYTSVDFDGITFWVRS